MPTMSPGRVIPSQSVKRHLNAMKGKIGRSIKRSCFTGDGRRRVDRSPGQLKRNNVQIYFLVLVIDATQIRTY